MLFVGSMQNETIIQSK